MYRRYLLYMRVNDRASRFRSAFSYRSPAGVTSTKGLNEEALASIALRLVQLGVGQLIVAGGETVKALGISGLRIGPEIDPGVPWTVAIHNDRTVRTLTLALKLANFGSVGFFMKVWDLLA
jgi:uncharacterized protein YgbK (DUF1537 family)